MPITAEEQALRDRWLQTPEGKRFLELRELWPLRTPKENEEHQRLYQAFLKVGMTPKERAAFDKQRREDIKQEERETREAEAAERREERELEHSDTVQEIDMPNLFARSDDLFQKLHGMKYVRESSSAREVIERAETSYENIRSSAEVCDIKAVLDNFSDFKRVEEFIVTMGGEEASPLLSQLHNELARDVSEELKKNCRCTDLTP